MLELLAYMVFMWLASTYSVCLGVQCSVCECVGACVVCGATAVRPPGGPLRWANWRGARHDHASCSSCYFSIFGVSARAMVSTHLFPYRSAPCSISHFTRVGCSIRSPNSRASRPRATRHVLGGADPRLRHLLAAIAVERLAEVQCDLHMHQQQRIVADHVGATAPRA